MTASESTEEVLASVTKLLKHQVFTGRFVERRLIDVGKISMYKDVVVVDKSEKEFIKTLKSANDTLVNHFKENIITCIAAENNVGASSPYSIWTNLDGVTLGCHWFQVKNVSLCNDIFHITLKSLRPLKDDQDTSASAATDMYPIKINFKAWIAAFLALLTKENLGDFLRFLAVLAVTFLLGCFHLFELALAAVKEVNVFVKNITPVLVACVDGVTKIVGGFFILIAMMWNSWTRKNVPYHPLLQAGRSNQQPLFLDYPMMGGKSQPMGMAALGLRTNCRGPADTAVSRLRTKLKKIRG